MIGRYRGPRPTPYHYCKLCWGGPFTPLEVVRHVDLVHPVEHVDQVGRTAFGTQSASSVAAISRTRLTSLLRPGSNHG